MSIYLQSEVWSFDGPEKSVFVETVLLFHLYLPLPLRFHPHHESSKLQIWATSALYTTQMLKTRLHGSQTTLI